ncbi:hypothetical protein BDW02DRAFT_487245 [Decorospora gaudefroyi]|uniref:Uncharacterized protein n=1 Tax=Decorospora gaudefroyi TaxID=184978 RepID=A0A6A5KWX3_9PLEO|nr:hypothetical protein BDW02DRAFT_487245 [Decorospora gaudefroyi]
MLYKAASASYSKQYVLVAQVNDTTHIQPQKLLAQVSNGTESIHDIRLFHEVEIFDLNKVQNNDNPPPTLLLALIEPQPGPDPASDLDAWYRQEHNQQMAEQPGWRRTCRYELSECAVGDAGGKAGGENVELRFLAIHEFGDENLLGDEVGVLEPVSEWTKRVMGQAVGIEAAIFRRVG